MTALLLDMRSARLVTPATDRGRMRVFLWPDRIEAWGLEGGKVVRLFVAWVANIDRGSAPNRPTANRPWTINTTDGDSWTLLRDASGGCNCGSSLAKIKPERVEA